MPALGLVGIRQLVYEEHLRAGQKLAVERPKKLSYARLGSAR
jgi:hypothetical protein